MTDTNNSNIEAGKPRAIHKCSTCAKADVWGPTWSWYGCYRDLEDGNPIQKYCSDACGGQSND